MPASEVLEQLYSLKSSSPNFLRVLYALIRTDEVEQYSASLQGPELTRLVDFLDGVRPLPSRLQTVANENFEGPLFDSHHR
jgi:hypothetical protein